VKKNLITIIILLSILLGLVSSASGKPISTVSMASQADQQSSDKVVARVYYTSQEQLNQLASRYDILSVDQEQQIAYILLTMSELVALQHAGYRVDIDEAKTSLLTQPHITLPGQGTDSIPGFPCYRTVEETYASMLQIAIDHPNLAEWYAIGQSWDKSMAGGPSGYDINVLHLTNQDFDVEGGKPTFFLMAEIHAREYATAEMAARFAEYLVNNYGMDPDITWLLDYFQVYIVPMTNPDGRKFAEAGDWWRKNTDSDDGCSDPNNWGTDLNRNYGFHWGGAGSSPYACDETYRGSSANSEPETQSIEKLILSIFLDQRGEGDTDPAPLDTTGMLITLHSYGPLVLWPWGWTAMHAPNAAQLQTLGKRMAYFNHYNPQQSYNLYATTGTTDDWSYGTLGIASYTFEMAGQFFQPCSNFETTDVPDNLQALRYAFKSARLPYMNPTGPETLSLEVTPALVNAGELILLTATANDTRYGGSGEPTQNIIAARYSMDEPSWIAGATYPMTASDGTFDSKVEGIQAIIDTAGWVPGQHTIFVESQDANNNWGVASAIFININETGKIIHLPYISK
jgi:carboxypeptidase T